MQRDGDILNVKFSVDVYLPFRFLISSERSSYPGVPHKVPSQVAADGQPVFSGTFVEATSSLTDIHPFAFHGDAVNDVANTLGV